MIKYIDGSNQAELDLAIKFLTAQQFFGLDTETTGLDPLTCKVLLISAGNENLQYVFDVARMGQKIQLLKPIFESTDTLKVLQNAKFDYKMLKANLGITLENIYDTMLAEKMLLIGRKKSGFGLDDLVHKYCRIELDKSTRNTFEKTKYGDEFSPEQIEYSGIDVKHLGKVLAEQRTILQRHNMLDVAMLEMDTCLVAGDMELNGVYLNQSLWKLTEDTTNNLRLKAIDEVDAFFLQHYPADLFGRPEINYNSPAQLLVGLHKVIGPKATRLKSTAKEALEQVDHEVIHALLELKKAQKRVDAFGETFFKENVHPITGRIHATFDQLGTDTGRFAGKEPNLMQIPKQQIYRSAFTSQDSNHKMVGADYSAMELRLLADLSQEDYWLEMFENDKDAHCAIAERIYKKPIRKAGTNGPDDPGENYELRDPAKSLNFLVCYGGGKKKLARNAKISEEQAGQMLDTFWYEFPKIKTFFETYVAQSIKKHCLRNPYDNRLRWLDGFDPDNGGDVARMKNMAMNYPMQSTNASITKKALVLLREAIRNKDIRITSVIHDEILLESHKDSAEEAKALLESCMVKAGEMYVKKVKIKADAYIADCWTKH